MLLFTLHYLLSINSYLLAQKLLSFVWDLCVCTFFYASHCSTINSFGYKYSSKSRNVNDLNCNSETRLNCKNNKCFYLKINFFCQMFKCNNLNNDSEISVVNVM